MSGLLLLYRSEVLPSWVDYNGHMRDAAFVIVFSEAVKKLPRTLGIGNIVPDVLDKTLISSEFHLTYLKEVGLGDELTVLAQILGYDQGSAQVMLRMDNSAGQAVAFYETVLSANEELRSSEEKDGINAVATGLQKIAGKHSTLGRPSTAGTAISLQRGKLDK